MPAMEKWWDKVIKSDFANYYSSAAQAERDDGSGKNNSGRKGSFIWGDRVRVLKENQYVSLVSGRGVEYWVHHRHLGEQSLLEVYVIDVGQGDGVLVVTPEGHHIMIDGGNLRSSQNSGKNAADFVDWKFYKDYLSKERRLAKDHCTIRLDALIATHNDIDHFGGLFDLIDHNAKNKSELNCSDVSVQFVGHAGLSWWYNNKKQNNRSLGEEHHGFYTQLLNDRDSALKATANLASPDVNTLAGTWGAFIAAATKLKNKHGQPTDFVRLYGAANNFLPGFEPHNSKCAVRVLGPVATTVEGKPALIKFPDGDSKNTNGHSVVLRLDYGERRILLTGDLNTHSQNHIMKHYGEQFLTEFKSDVAKGCHHGSHDVSYRFLEGMRPLCTVISSGDAETHDHPRPTIIAASSITGRRLIDHQHDRLICPLIYMTEVARSVKMAKISQLQQFDQPQPPYAMSKPTKATKSHKTNDEKSHFRLLLGSSQESSFDWPRLDLVQVVRGLRYGLINIRTDGHRLFFAQMEETGSDWAITILTSEQINSAR